MLARILPLKVNAEIKQIKEKISLEEAVAELKECGLDEMLAFYLKRYPIEPDEENTGWAEMIDLTLAPDPVDLILENDIESDTTSNDVTKLTAKELAEILRISSRLGTCGAGLVALFYFCQPLLVLLDLFLKWNRQAAPDEIVEDRAPGRAGLGVLSPRSKRSPTIVERRPCQLQLFADPDRFGVDGSAFEFGEAIKIRHWQLDLLSSIAHLGGFGIASAVRGDLV